MSGACLQCLKYSLCRQFTRLWNKAVVFSVFPWQRRYPEDCCFILPEQKSKTEKEVDEKPKRPRFPIRVPQRWPSRVDSVSCKSNGKFYNLQLLKTQAFFVNSNPVACFKINLLDMDCLQLWRYLWCYLIKNRHISRIGLFFVCF